MRVCLSFFLIRLFFTNRVTPFGLCLQDDLASAVPSELADSYFLEEWERLQVRWAELDHQRQTFERERQSFTDAAIRLSHEVRRQVRASLRRKNVGRCPGAPDPKIRLRVYSLLQQKRKGSLFLFKCCLYFCSDVILRDRRLLSWNSSICVTRPSLVKKHRAATGERARFSVSKTRPAWDSTFRMGRIILRQMHGLICGSRFLRFGASQHIRLSSHHSIFHQVGVSCCFWITSRKSCHSNAQHSWALLCP